MLLVCENLRKEFPSGQEKIQILDSISLKLDMAQSLSIVGPSGSGKTTLLRLMAGLLRPDEGRVLFRGEDLADMSQAQRDALRLNNMGMVFQDFHLLKHLTALENVELPLRFHGAGQFRPKALEMLHRVGLHHRKHFFPEHLSGGERQRVALARALSCGPKLILADEPTGSLDAHNGAQVADLLFQLVEQSQAAMVLVTHNESLGLRCQHRISLA